MTTEIDLEPSIDAAFTAALAARGNGRVARYIPELAKANPNACALAVADLHGNTYARGDFDSPFSLQSISKVFALALGLEHAGERLRARVDFEPSGDTFHSIMRLEEEQGRPRNPLINAGAIATTELLPGTHAQAKVQGLQTLLRRAVPGGAFVIDEAVYRSELRTGYRNRALANYMQHFGVVDDAEVAADAYFRQCAVTTTTGELAQLGALLANRGATPGGDRLFAAETCRTVLAVMLTCGLYDEVGQFAVDVGLPAKSGVSGGMLAVVPGRYGIACWGPALGAKGNSTAGLAALQTLSGRLSLSLLG